MKIKYIALFLLIILLLGCQRGMVRPNIETKTNTPIYAEHFSPSAWNMPMGSVIPEGSNLVIRKRPSSSGGMMVGMLFGPLGVAVTNESMKSDTTEVAPTLEALKNFNSANEVNKLIKTKAENNSLGQQLAYVGTSADAHHYEIRPYNYLAIGSNERAQISVVLKVTEFDKNRTEIWSGQYVRHIPVLYSLQNIRDGANGASPNELISEVKAATNIAVNVLINDLNNYLDAEHKATLSFVNVLPFTDIELNGNYLFDANTKYHLFRSPAASAAPIWFGLHIFDANQINVISEG
jgi:hypothetical protein